MRALVAIAFLALTGVAAAAAFEQGGPRGAEAEAIAASGNFQLGNSGEGEAIFGAGEISPGDSASGSVEIANPGGEPAQLVLAQHDLADSVGAGGGALSERMSLRVRDVTVAGQPTTVYAGPLAPMPPQAAGVLAAGETRRYEFVAALPPVGPGEAALENAVQGASVSVAYSWTARETNLDPAPGPGGNPGSGGGSTPGAGQGGGAAPPVDAPAVDPPLRLRLVRVGRAVRRGRVVVRARCNRACRIAVRGRVRVRIGAASARARIHSHGRLRPGVQRLKLRLPRRIKRWLRTHPGRARVRARLLLVARDADGQRARTRRSTRALPVR